MERKKAGILGITLLLMAAALWGCSRPEENKGDTPVTDVALADIEKAVAAVFGDNYVPNTEYDAGALESEFGVKQDWYENAIAKGPMISAQVDTFVGIEAKKDHAQEVEDALLAYRKRLLEDTMQYPMNQIKIQASQVVRYGNYVFFLMLGELSMEDMDRGDQAALEAAKAENQKAVDVVEEMLYE
ncbi:DUF4358 domain-containing protein [Diplocloster agilis]|uniref:DUF4358 domain-containing protein n=1 Tax=Diplocloster agilis TaxID=2850323 RepID=UPI0008210E3D|nr:MULTISPECIES: DUF4358 domain-containing protein [Lachnospiraceae]MBU9745004.1 DUF4358 domain-containing protein [Diplocloster agilis]MCU6732101.1 DUF4358 domain-containing protein [Suonthocola fibrivorans]SCI33487.1 Uncharacterised protein [uncultured Clostridium sp.]